MIRKCFEKNTDPKKYCYLHSYLKNADMGNFKFFLYFNLSIFFSIYKFIYLGKPANKYELCGTSPDRHGLKQLSIHLSICLAFNLSFYISTFLSVYLGESANKYESCGTSPNRYGLDHLSICLAFNVSFYISTYLSFFLSIYPIYLSR